MPRLVEELTPMQVEWLIENQNAGEAGIMETDRIALNQQLGNVSSVFRSSVHADDISETSSARKRKRESMENSEASQGSRRGGFFPHRGLKLTWDQSFENLVAYKSMYGDCNVPRNFPACPQLGKWVYRQRIKAQKPDKYGKLSDEQRTKLTGLGMVWLTPDRRAPDSLIKARTVSDMTCTPMSEHP